MGFYAEPWLREARDYIQSVPGEICRGEAGPGDFEKLADAVEKAIKAALIESSGRIPQQLETQNLVSMCQATGVWDVLPPALRSLVKEVAALRSNGRSQESTSANSSTQLRRYFQIARGLIDYMEFHVIGNDSVLKRLKVA